VSGESAVISGIALYLTAVEKLKKNITK